MSGRRPADQPRPDLAYALRLLASGQGIGSVWREAGYASRKALADSLYTAADRIGAPGPRSPECAVQGQPERPAATPGRDRGAARGVAGRKQGSAAGGRTGLRVVAYSDGGSIGNPGPAGCGAVLLDESGEVLLEDHRYLGQTTNNVAEYEGAVLALARARELGAREVELRVDSELLVNQIKGGYRVKSANLAGLYAQLKQIADCFDRFEISQIARGENKRADKLANLAIASRGRGQIGAASQQNSD